MHVTNMGSSRELDIHVHSAWLSTIRLWLDSSSSCHKKWNRPLWPFAVHCPCRSNLACRLVEHWIRGGSRARSWGVGSLIFTGSWFIYRQTQKYWTINATFLDNNQPKSKILCPLLQNIRHWWIAIYSGGVNGVIRTTVMPCPNSHVSNYSDLKLGSHPAF